MSGTEETAMSRAEELRAKFRKKGEETIARIDERFFDFSACLNDFVIKNYNAATLNSEYEHRLYEEFRIDAPTNLDKWLKDKTRGEFRSIFGPPRWIDEPTWCFHGGKPLEFMHQFEDDFGNTFYVFRGSREIGMDNSDSKYSISLYKMCAQSPMGSIKFTDNLIS
jgi:hypothetical protein